MSINTSKQSGVTTSFRKRGAEVLHIRGSRVSFQNAQLLTSTGSSTLDFFLGGGLAVGTICLIEADHYQTYSSLLLRYFLAEGVTNAHSLLLASGDTDPSKILKDLPAVKTIEINVDATHEDTQSDDTLKIAWRYKGKTVVDANDGSFNHNFDLSMKMPAEKISACHITTYNPCHHASETDNRETFIAKTYSELLRQIQNEIQTKGLKTSSKSCDNILRIGISSIGSPLWACNGKQSKNILRFLYALKALLRSSFSVAMVTVPSILLQDSVITNRLQQMGDTVIRLESFVGSDKKTNPLFKDFDGLLHVVKLPILNTFMYQIPTTDLAFKVKKRNFRIERLHLPPDIDDHSTAEQNTMGCGGQTGRLDF